MRLKPNKNKKAAWKSAALLFPSAFSPCLVSVLPLQGWLLGTTSPAEARSPSPQLGGMARGVAHGVTALHPSLWEVLWGLSRPRQYLTNQLKERPDRDPALQSRCPKPEYTPVLGKGSNA